VDATQIGQAGLVGLRGRLGRRLADGLGKRTRFDADAVAALIGAYLFVSSAWRIVQMVRRMKRGDTT
jgi:predicted NBD/HSP70 family sugar kinase